MGYNGGKLLNSYCMHILQTKQLELRFLFLISDITLLLHNYQESGQISITDYVRLTSAEWYLFFLCLYLKLKVQR